MYVHNLKRQLIPKHSRKGEASASSPRNDAELCVQSSGDRRVVTNPEGFHYESMKTEVKTSREQAPQWQAVWKVYAAIRRRFLAAYERKINGEATSHGVKMIETGSRKAHGGNCKTDAQIVGSGPDSEKEAYTTLYRVTPAEMKRMNKFRKESTH